MKKRFLPVIIIFSFFSNYASDGTLDTATFNPPNGFVTIPLGFGATAAGIQTDGKIVVTGNLTGASAGLLSQTVRYNADGSIDNSFVNNSVPDFSVSDLIIQPDGNIIIVGGASTGSPGRLVRYLPNGDFDPTFGNSGIVNLPNTGTITAVILQPDSKIVVGGFDETGTLLRLIRLLPNGTIDTIFQTTVSAQGAATGIVIQPDGKVVTTNVNASGQWQVIRYNPTGNLDTSFNGTGVVVLSTLEMLIVNSAGVLLQPSSDGKIIAGAFSGGIYLVRLNTDGSVDTSFAASSMSPITPIATGFASSLVLQADSKIVIAGITSDLPRRFLMIRVTADGVIDTSWNAAGPMPGFTTEPEGIAQGSTIQADGKIIAVGRDALGINYIVARYNSSPAFTSTAILSPVSSSPVAPGIINFSGTAQNPAMVYLFIDGVLVGGTQTIGSTNIWTIPTTLLSLGAHTAYAVSIYQDKKLNITSEIINFTVREIPCIVPSLVNASELVRSIILKYCCK